MLSNILTKQIKMMVIIRKMTLVGFLSKITIILLAFLVTLLFLLKHAVKQQKVYWLPPHISIWNVMILWSMPQICLLCALEYSYLVQQVLCSIGLHRKDRKVFLVWILFNFVSSQHNTTQVQRYIKKHWQRLLLNI